MRPHKIISCFFCILVLVGCTPKVDEVVVPGGPEEEVFRVPLTGIHPLANDQHLGVLLIEIGNASFVLLGEASAGTAECYSWRAAITRRLVERLGTELPQDLSDRASGLLKLFPSPQAIAEARLDSIGMPGKRVATLQRLAAAVADGTLTLQIDDGVDALIGRLCELPGIGPWTAEYIVLRGFGDADAFPAADLGLLKAPLWGSQGITARQLLVRAEAWRPRRAYAAVHIWADYENALALTKQKAIKTMRTGASPIVTSRTQPSAE